MTYATQKEIEKARNTWQSDDVEIDSNALASHGDEGTWIQAWVRIPEDTDVDMDLPDGAMLYLDDLRGVHIPRDFFASTEPDCINWNNADKAWILEQCSNANNDGYWEAWDEFCDKCTLTDPKSRKEYQVFQDAATGYADVWLIPLESGTDG